jgi:hypothetical protein
MGDTIWKGSEVLWGNKRITKRSVMEVWKCGDKDGEWI